MHFEPSALYQSKWEEDELGATSSETRSHADKSDKALWSASNQTDCKYFETITSSEFISSTQVCFKRHSAKCLYVANVQRCSKPTAKFQLERKYSQSELTISDHANFYLRAILWVQREFVTASCNYSAQVAKVYYFQWLQSKLNLAIVSLFLEDFCRIFRRNNNIRV